MQEHYNLEYLDPTMLREGASPGAIRDVETRMGFRLPHDYVSFMLVTNGYTGPLRDDETLILWPIETLIDQNESYCSEEFLPGIFLVGSNGVGDAYGFDLRDPDIPFVRVPFIPMDLSYVERAASSLGAFLAVPSGSNPSDEPSEDAIEADIYLQLLRGAAIDFPTNSRMPQIRWPNPGKLHALLLRNSAFLIERRRQASLEQILEKMPSSLCQNIMTMYHIEDMDIERISDALGLPFDRIVDELDIGWRALRSAGEESSSLGDALGTIAGDA